MRGGRFHAEQNMAAFKDLRSAMGLACVDGSPVQPPKPTQPRLAPGRMARKLLCNPDYRSLYQ